MSLFARNGTKTVTGAQSSNGSAYLTTVVRDFIDKFLLVDSVRKGQHKPEALEHHREELGFVVLQASLKLS